MRAKGNGAPDVCANNLLRMVRGEVPFERVKGLDPRLVDKVLTDARTELEADAEWLIDNYEPRVEFNGIGVAQADTESGGVLVTANITKKGGIADG